MEHDIGGSTFLRFLKLYELYKHTNGWLVVTCVTETMVVKIPFLSSPYFVTDHCHHRRHPLSSHSHCPFNRHRRLFVILSHLLIFPLSFQSSLHVTYFLSLSLSTHLPHSLLENVACTAERYFRVDRAQEHLHYVVDICNEDLYILDEDSICNNPPSSPSPTKTTLTFSEGGGEERSNVEKVATNDEVDDEGGREESGEKRKEAVGGKNETRSEHEEVTLPSDSSFPAAASSRLNLLCSPPIQPSAGSDLKREYDLERWNPDEGRGIGSGEETKKTVKQEEHEGQELTWLLVRRTEEEDGERSDLCVTRTSGLEVGQVYSTDTRREGKNIEGTHLRQDGSSSTTVTSSGHQVTVSEPHFSSSSSCQGSSNKIHCVRGERGTKEEGGVGKSIFDDNEEDDHGTLKENVKRKDKTTVFDPHVDDGKHDASSSSPLFSRPPPLSSRPPPLSSSASSLPPQSSSPYRFRERRSQSEMQGSGNESNPDASQMERGSSSSLRVTSSKDVVKRTSSTPSPPFVSGVHEQNLQALPSSSHSQGLLELFEAAKSNNVSRMKHLHENESINITSSDKNGQTVLHIASGLGHEEVVSYLITVAPSLMEIRNREGRTALHEAARTRNRKVVGILAVAGSKLSLTDREGSTARDLALKSDDQHLASYLERECLSATLLSLSSLSSLSLLFFLPQSLN